MARKRDRREAEDPSAGPSTSVANDTQSPESGSRQQTRAQVMQQIARRRAAHFAHFSSEGDDERNPHVGGSNARELGPWSSAVELADAREAAMARREQEMRSRTSNDEQESEESTWTPHAYPGKAGKRTSAVPPLADLALDTVVSLMEDVESLAGLPDTVMTKISERCYAKRAMSPHVVSLFIEGAVGDLVIDDCTLLEPADLAEALCSVAGPRLEMVRLGLCGRGLTEQTVKAFASKGPFPALRTLHLGGAYRLRDAELALLLRACPNLRSLSLPQACRLNGDALMAWTEHGQRGLDELDLSDDRGIDGEILLEVIPKLGPLRALNLSGCDLPLDRAFIGSASAPAVFGGLALQEIDLERCPGVTDEVVAALSSLFPQLRHCVLDECSGVTDVALEALASNCHQLETLSLRRCQRITETGLKPIVKLGTIKRLCLAGIPIVGSELLGLLAAYSGSQLERLDVSWCRKLTDRALGQLVDACPHLTRLDLWGCSQLTSRFLEGYGKKDLCIYGRGEPHREVAVF